jgi:uncharacterized protein YuzE
MNAKKIILEVSTQVNYETGDVSAVYFYIRPGKSALVKEFAGGCAFADYDRNGHLLGIEILAPCQIAVLDKIARRESKPIKNFLRNSIPREMALAD